MNSSTLRAAGVGACLALVFVATTATAQKRSRRSGSTTRAVAAKKPVDPPKTAGGDVSPGGVAALSSSVGSALASHTRGGQWGAIVVSLTRGDTLFAQNADGMMQPASTMKMYTSAVALDQFGPDFTFHTPVLRDGSVGNDGTLAGNLYLKGVGDPSMSRSEEH